MNNAPILISESLRLATLHAYKILDTPIDQGFEDIVDAVRAALHVPIALVSLVDSNRQWFKAARGMDLCETSREVAICARTILSPEPLVISDLLLDTRFRDNPFVTSGPKIRFYLGVPIVAPNGQNLGTVCALDTYPRPQLWSEVSAMKFLARQTARLLELHRLQGEAAGRSPEVGFLPKSA